jgi:hypothetical protein
MWIGYSRGRDWRGARPVGLDYSTGSDRRGVVPSGPGPPLATPLPEPTDGGRDRHPRDPFMYPTHHTRAAQRAATAAKRKEHQGLPRPTKRSYLDFCTLVVYITFISSN